MPTHAEKKLLPYTPEQMFDLVADIERYSEFLPWCTACHITKREGDVLTADLTVGFKVFAETFTSRVTLDPKARRIGVEYLNGPFKYLNNHWAFNAAKSGCEVDFFIDFEFHSGLLQKAMTLFFNEAVQRMIRAFEERAAAIYGN